MPYKLVHVASIALAVFGSDVASAVPWDYDLDSLQPHLRRMVEAELKRVAPPFGESFRSKKIHGAAVQCVNGLAGKFPCSNVDMLSFTPDSDLVSDPMYESEASDIWGWTNPDDGKEWVIHTTRTGFSFVDISDPVNPIPVAFLPRYNRGSFWSDVKVYKDHAFCVADSAPGQFMQVVDLKRVAGLQPQANGKPVSIKEDVHFIEWGEASSRGRGSAHNIVINEATGYAYIVGADGCGGGLFIVNIQNPKQPTFEACYNDKVSRRGYVHDAECVIYKGPDVRYQGREVCFSYNEDKLEIADVTDKKNIQMISAIGYDFAQYTHQGWLNDEQTHLLMDDELDETAAWRNPGTAPKPMGTGRTRTLIWDVTNLEKPVHSGDFYHPENAVDHNLYIRDGIAYQSNYAAGLKVLDVKNIGAENGVKEVGKFDCAPNSPTGPKDAPVMGPGTWSNYPYFKSKVIAVSSIDRGLFLLKFNENAVQDAKNQSGI